PELIRRPDPLAIASPADFSAALTSLREQAGITIRDLAKLVGATSSTLGGYFAGRHLPAMSAIPVVEKILEACGVPAGPARQAWIDALTRVRRLPGPRPADAPIPYRGLESYGADDAAYFYGREVLVARLVALVTSSAAAGPTLLVGPSGSGKSSALQAGLAARLRAGGNWEIFTLTPGSHPQATLDRTLDEIRRRRLPPGSRVAVIVDQFEEVFTLCGSEPERQAFVRAVTSPMHAGPGIGPALTVVIALRADFYGAALGFEPLSHALQDRQVVVGPMSATDLRRAIAEPARAAGVTIDPGLVELLLHDMAPAAGTPASAANGAATAAAAANGAASGVSANGSMNATAIGSANVTPSAPEPVATRPGHDPGALPLMSFALLETWQRGRRSRLTVEDYVAAGGIQGAVAAAAERVYEQLSPDLAEATRQLFLRLVAVSNETADTRRRVTAAELGLDTPEGDATADVLERFVAARLLTTGETTVEIAHESLLTAWPRLRGWLDADHAGLVTHRRLADAAMGWQRDARDPALLHRGGILITAREWAADAAHARELNTIERAFLDASIEARERELRVIRHRTRRMQALLAAATVLAVLTAALSAMAFTQRSAAAHDRDQAMSRQLAEAADRLRHTDPSVAGQFAVMAWHTAPTSEARSALLDTSATPLARRLEGPGGPAAVAASGDGRVLAAAGDRGGLRVWTLGQDDQLSAAEAATVPAADSRPLYAVAVTRTGSLAATAGASGVLHLFDLADPRRPGRLPDILASRSAVLGLATSADGHTLAVVSGDGLVRLFNIDGTRLTLLGSPFALGKESALQAVAFSADGRALAAAGSGGRVSLWNLTDRAQPAPVAVQPAGPTTTVTSLAFSPDGRRLLAGSKDQHVYLWQLAAAGTAPVRFDDAGSWVNSVAFSPDGALFTAGSSDHHLRIYELATRVKVADLPHPGPITAATYLPDGRGLLSGAADGMVRIWPSPSPAAPMPTARTFALGYLDGGRLAAVTSK
ncbi:MAG TPA: helix-turn-helix domain-containing protein, partial [Kineosporiaceae bacterium]|nr:helix-turn-helix domain-containing protein [Kineosporiaceae bacterium]